MAASMFGIAFANSGPFARPENAAMLAEHAERVGFESLWTVEHVVIPKAYASVYPYDASGRAPAAETADIPDPLIWLAYVAGRTTRLRLGTGILILPQRSPLVLAKEVASLAQLAEGRVMLGIGSGWLREEFDALGIAFDDRGARTDDHITALRTIWRDGREGATHHSAFTNFDRCISLPTPPGGSVPIIVGGHTARAARRAGELGDGFFPGKGSPAELAPLLATMRAAAERAGRDPSVIELTTGAGDADTMVELRRMGFTRFVVPPPTYNLAKLPDALERRAAMLGVG